MKRMKWARASSPHAPAVSYTWQASHRSYWRNVALPLGWDSWVVFLSHLLREIRKQVLISSRTLLNCCCELFTSVLHDGDGVHWPCKIHYCTSNSYYDLLNVLLRHFAPLWSKSLRGKSGLLLIPARNLGIRWHGNKSTSASSSFIEYLLVLSNIRSHSI